MKCRAWIIDDFQIELDRAQEVITSTARDMDVTIESTPSQRFVWPLAENTRPDIVILDLYNDQALDGIDIYKCIREEEQHLKKNGGNFKNHINAECYIILWSSFLGSPEAMEYFQPRSYVDHRLTLCTVKSKVLLKNALTGCIKRMLEEDI